MINFGPDLIRNFNRKIIGRIAHELVPDDDEITIYQALHVALDRLLFNVPLIIRAEIELEAEEW